MSASTKEQLYAVQADKLGTTPEHLQLVVRRARIGIIGFVVVVVLGTLLPEQLRSAVGFMLLGALVTYYGGAVRALFTRRS